MNTPPRKSCWPDEPWSLGQNEVLEERIRLLDQPHMHPLTEYARSMMVELGDGYEVPFFDPLDGGVRARVLVLSETPGPKAVGTGLVSRNNPDPSARNTFNAFQQERIPRDVTLLWNVAPWFISSISESRNATPKDLRKAAPYTNKLVSILRNLEFVLLIGRQAQRAEQHLTLPSRLKVLRTYHTAGRSYSHQRCREHIHATLAELRGCL